MSSALADNDVPPVVLNPVAHPRLWGPWSTIGWTIIALLLTMLAQTVVQVMFVVTRVRDTARIDVSDLATNGSLLAAATLFSAPPVLGLIYLLIAVRRYPVWKYLALRWPAGKQIALSCAGLLGFVFLSDALSYLLGRPIAPEVMVTAYQTSIRPLLLIALLIGAPLVEEVIMRGFLFQGIASSRWGVGTAVFVSSIMWALLHVQYDRVGIATIFLMGVYLGVVRHLTASLPLTMLLHSVANLVATVQILVVVNVYP